MLANTDGIVQFGQPGFDAVCRLVFQRLQHREPGFRVRVVPLPQFRGQHQHPCHAVGALEGCAAGFPQEGELVQDVLRRETAPQLGAGLLRKRGVGEQPQQAYQQPVTMYIRMPVVASIERRRKNVRRQCIRIRLQGEADVIGVFIMQALECEIGKARGGCHVQRRSRSRGQRGGRCSAEQNEHQTRVLKDPHGLSLRYRGRARRVAWAVYGSSGQ